MFRVYMNGARARHGDPLRYLVETWLPMESAPKTGMGFLAHLGGGKIVEAHFAQDLSGSEQPPFSGFFTPVYDPANGRVLYNTGVLPIGWRRIE